MSKAVDAVSKVFAAVFKPIAKLLAPSVDNPKASDTSNTKQTIRSGKEPAHFIYGRTATGGVLFWAQEEPGSGAEHEKLHMAYLLAEGEIDGIEQVYVNQELASEYGDLVEWELHVNRSTPDPFMLEHCPDWKDSQIGRGVSWVRVTLTFDKDKFATGIPDLLFVVRGNRNIYDPRTGETGYSDNAVLCTLDYVRNRLGVADEFIVFDAWAAAANIADETITDPDGNNHKRYAIGGVYKADQRKDETLASLEENFGGTTRRIGGYWGVEVGAYYGPAVVTLTEDMVIGSVTGRSEVKRSDAINSVTGKWNSPDDLWEETSYPTVTVDEWVAEDGGENSDTLDTPFSPNAHQSQRLANIKLRRQRAGGQFEIPLNHAGYQFRPGRIINVELPTINISGEFKVLEWRFGAKKGATIVVRQEDPEFYDDAVGEPFDYLSIIQVPAGGIGSPTNLRYTVETVGEVVQGRLTWDPVNAAIDYNVVIQRDTEVIQAVKTPSGATTCTLSGLGAGDYTASVTARGLQSTSGPATIVFSILNPPQPERVITQADRTNVMLIPVLADGDSLGGGTWGYRWSTTDTFGDSEYLGRGDTITHTGRSPGQTLYYWVRGVNAYGASDWFAVSVETSNSFDDEIAAIDDELRRPGGLVDQFENGINDNAEAIDAARADFEAGLEQANDGIDQANTAITAAQALIDGIDTRVDASEGAITDAQGRIDSVESLAESNDQRLTVVASDVDVLSGSVGENSASITESNRILELDGKLEAIRAAVSAAQNAVASTSISVESISRINDVEALSQRIISLQSAFDDTSIADLEQRLTTIATESEALSDQLTSLLAQFDENTVAEIDNRITALATEVSAVTQSVTSLQSQLGDTIASIEEVQRTVALNDKLEAITSAVSATQNAVGSATQTVETLTRISGDEALAQRITTLSGDFDGNVATLTQQLTTLADDTQAISDSLDSLSAEVGDSNADFEQRITALATATSAITQDVTSLQSQIGDAVASIDDVQQTQILDGIYTALQNAVIQTQSSVGSAAVNVERLTSVSERQALAQQIIDLGTEFGDTTSSINSTLTSLSSAQSAIAQRQDTFEASVDDEFASVNQDISAVYDPSTGAVARAVTTVEVNGKKAMIGMQVDGQTAEIVAVANTFAVLNPVSNELVTAFVVTDGRVIIPEALIDSLVVTKLRSTNGSLVFDGDKLKADYIDVDNLKVKWANVQNIVILWADIQGVKILTADIEDGAINTLKIAGDAVSVGVGARALNNWVYLDNGYGERTVVSQNFDPLGGRTKIIFSCLVRPPWGSMSGRSYDVTFRVKRDGTTLFTVPAGFVATNQESANPICLQWLETPGAGSFNYSVTAQSSANPIQSVSVKDFVLTLESMRR